MDIIKNIAKIHTKDINRLEMARKDLKISQTFISRCLGKSDSAWNQWLHTKKELPSEHLDQVINIFKTAENLLKGRKCLPIKNGDDPDQKAGIRKEHLDSIIDFLELVKDPQISIFSDRVKETMSILKIQAELASEILNHLKKDNLL